MSNDVNIGGGIRPNTSEQRSEDDIKKREGGRARFASSALGRVPLSSKRRNP